MTQGFHTSKDESVLEESYTNGLGRLTFRHPSGTFALTPASRILLNAIAENKDMLHGLGMDWGSGVGCQAILAAKIDAVHTVYGLEILKDNVDTSIKNAEENGVGQKTRFIFADSYLPFDEAERQEIQALRGKVDFILSNPPSSEWDDGFGYRRIVLSGAQEFLKENGIVLLNASFQYGMDRIKALSESLPRFRYMGVAASTGCVPFDLSRPDLLDCLKVYAEEERKGGVNYTFIKDESNENSFINAHAALADFEKSGASPFTKWQTLLFRFSEKGI